MSIIPFIKYSITNQINQPACILFKPEDEELIRIGEKDIVIKKEGYRNYCYCKQHSYNYQGIEGALIGMEGKKNRFILKRLQVYQMEESKEQEEQPVLLFFMRN